MDRFKNALGTAAFVVVFVVSMYLGYFIFKTVSYWIFYEDMVTETIEENVAYWCLKKNNSVMLQPMHHIADNWKAPLNGRQSGLNPEGD